MSCKMICGRYKHYKGKQYIVYTEAKDAYGNKYVLYQQQYGDKTFWIRPYKMFFEKVKLENGEYQRFEKIEPHLFASSEDAIKELSEKLNKKLLWIKHSETEEKYLIFEIVADDNYQYVQVVNIMENISAYLTDFQMALRLGVYFYKINNEIMHHKVKIKNLSPLEITKEEEPGNFFNITEQEFLNLTNPCSIDLHISKEDFLKPRRKCVDMLSVVYAQNPDSLWQRIHLKTYKSDQGIVLKPRQILITRTLEKIKLPEDCAGKIEIKSTYARLSVSVTTGDFCNPGWEGYYPLTIRNDSTNSIVIHPGEKMLQLSLIPINAPIIKPYALKSTYMKNKGYDDGTPQQFWNSKTVDNLRKRVGTDAIYEYFLNKKEAYDSNTEGEMRQRFEDSFLQFCDRNAHKKKYVANDGKIKLESIYNDYIKSEKIMEFFFSMPKSIIGTVFSFISIFAEKIFDSIIAPPENKDIVYNIFKYVFWVLSKLSVPILIICIILFIMAKFKYTTFCTSLKK